MREKARSLINLVKSGNLDAVAVLERVLFNYMSSDDAENFAMTEYLMDYEDEES